MLRELTLRFRRYAIALLFAIVPAISTAQITLVDVEAKPRDWHKAVAGMRVLGSWDLSALPDFGVSSMTGPLTSAGGGPIPADFLPSMVQIDSSGFNGTTSLAFIGPSANGSDNTENAIVPNQPQESFDIFFSTPVGAFLWDAFSYSNCSGSLGLINIMVVDDIGIQTLFERIPAPATGHLYGLVAHNRRGIVAVNSSYPGVESGLPGSNNYFPGIQGAATVFAPTKARR